MSDCLRLRNIHGHVRLDRCIMKSPSNGNQRRDVAKCPHFARRISEIAWNRQKGVLRNAAEMMIHSLKLRRSTMQYAQMRTPSAQPSDAVKFKKLWRLEALVRVCPNPGVSGGLGR